MTQVSVIIYLSLALLIAVFGANVGNSLLLFMAAGILPGTNIVLSSSMSLAVISATSGLIIFKLIRNIVLSYHKTKQPAKVKNRLPRRRFSSI
jgi:hypothetical protein